MTTLALKRQERSKQGPGPGDRTRSVGVSLDAGAFLPDGGSALDQARLAIRIVEAQGMTVVRDGDCHVVGRHQLTGGWVVDRGAEPRRVSLVGAVCLALQPLEGDLPEEGAAAALDVGPPWLLGLIAGWQSGRDSDPAGELAAGPARQLYRDGLEAGAALSAGR